MRPGTALDLFDYDLPPARIAVRPAEPRGTSRLLVLSRSDGGRRHRSFRDLTRELGPGDLLVRNDTCVIPARLRGKRASGGSVEVLLIDRAPSLPGETGEVWRCLAHPANRLRSGEVLGFRGGIEGTWIGDPKGAWRIALRSPRPVLSMLEEVGEIPLPLYVPRAPSDNDREWYQTVYARAKGSIAAPTAGLHFTTRLFERLRERGVEVASLTLHVGPGTFLPVRTSTIEAHRMLPERADVPETTARAILRTKREGGRVVAVGTTTVRALEGLYSPAGVAVSGEVSLFITPGHSFQVIDGLLTNFHLPRSTLLILVAAFAGREAVLEAYREAVALEYRFYSYGDAMLVV